MNQDHLMPHALPTKVRLVGGHNHGRVMSVHQGQPVLSMYIPEPIPLGWKSLADADPPFPDRSLRKEDYRPRTLAYDNDLPSKAYRTEPRRRFRVWAVDGISDEQVFTKIMEEFVL